MRIKTKTVVSARDHICFSGEAEFYYTDRELIEQTLEGLISKSCEKERKSAREAFPHATKIESKCIGHYERVRDTKHD